MLSLVDEERFKSVEAMIQILIKEMPQFRGYAQKASSDYRSQRALLRGLMNLRPPLPLNPDFMRLQDHLLQEEKIEKGIIDVFSLPVTSYAKVALYQGDITRLKADAIVNAANSQLLGCFVPGHNCIDNCIHSAAGLGLRNECYQIMLKQGHEEAPGLAKLTQGYNLPSPYVIHTVGPIVSIRPTNKQAQELASCYESCLILACRHHFRSLVFPCISTGAFAYPRQEAASIALETVLSFLAIHSDAPVVVFDTFLDSDYSIYLKMLR